MQLTDSGLVSSPSDLNHFVECEHLTALDLLAIEGKGVAKEKDPQADILRAKGFEHEQAWLQRLREEDREIVETAVSGNADWHRDAERTAAAMRKGAEVIYQAVFVDGDWRGIADFLIRVDRASQLGPWSYEARQSLRVILPPSFILQLAKYTETFAVTKA